MALERPPIESFIVGPQVRPSSKPPIENFIIPDKKTSQSRFGNPALDRQEARIASHPDLLKEAVTDDGKAHFSGVFSGGVGRNLKLASGIGQRITSAAVNPLIEAQRDPSALIDPRKYGKQAWMGLTGERRGEVGDVYTGAGANETASKVLGLGTELMLTAPDAIVNAPRNLQKFGQGVGNFMAKRKALGAIQKFGEMRKDMQAGKAMADELYNGAEQARKSAGTKQGNYIDTNAKVPVDPNELERIIGQLPESVQAEIRANPSVAKDVIKREESRQFVIKKGSDSKLTRPKVVKATIDERGEPIESLVKRVDDFGNPYEAHEVTGYKPTTKKAVITQTETKGVPNDIYGRAITETVAEEPKIAANLKNAETIRALIKGEVPVSKFNPKMLNMDEQNVATVAYQEIGKLMRAGHPKLQELMQNYAEIMNAVKKVKPTVRDRFGFSKTKPLIKMMDKVKESGDASVQQALVRLAEENPNIIPAVDKVRRFGEGVKKTKYYKEMAKKAVHVAAAGAGFGGVAKVIH